MPPWKPEPNFGSFHDERQAERAGDQDARRLGRAGAPEGDRRTGSRRRSSPRAGSSARPTWCSRSPSRSRFPAEGTRRLSLLRDPDPDRFGQDARGRRVPAGQSQGRPPRLAVPRQHRARLGLATRSTRAPAIPASADRASCQPAGWADGPPGLCPGSCPTASASSSARGATWSSRSTTIPTASPRPTSRPSASTTPERRPGRSSPASPSGRATSTSRRAKRAITWPRRASRLPADVQVIGITPHMHYIGKEMKVVAQTPDGKTVPLIWIKDWDFNWQGQYQYTSAVPLPKGSVIKLDAYYDNSRRTPATRAGRPSAFAGASRRPTRCACWAFRSSPTTSPTCARSPPCAETVSWDGTPGTSRDTRPHGSNRSTERKQTKIGSFAIPERFKEILGPFDQDGDGRHFRPRKSMTCQRPWPRRVRQAVHLRRRALREKSDPAK